MTVKKGQTIEATITDVAFGGRGLTKIDGFPIFVDKAITGDHAEIVVRKKKKNYAEARVNRLLSPSQARVPVRCAYSGYCGGCKWQFVDYETQLAYKTRQVKETLAHIGGLHDIHVQPARPSKKIFGYRNKMEFSCSDARWLLPEELGDPAQDRDFALGLHIPGVFHKVIDIDACHIQPNLGNAILGDVRNFIRASNLPVYGLKSHAGFFRFVMLRHSVHHNHWMVNLITAQDGLASLEPLARQLMSAYPEVVSVVNNITARKASIAIGEREILLAGTSSITDRISGYEFEISANSFFQTNTRGAETLYGIVKTYAELTGNETVLDLYSGTGTIPIILSQEAKEVIGIELIDSAVRDAEKNCARNGIQNCRFILGDILTRLPELTVQPDVLVIDPPRVGMHKKVLKQVMDLASPKIVYVSCNPATLARDLESLKALYHITEVTPVDLFPHTFHIESVAKLEKKTAHDFQTNPVSA